MGVPNLSAPCPLAAALRRARRRDEQRQSEWHRHRIRAHLLHERRWRGWRVDAGLFAGNLGVNVPQLMVRSSVLRISPLEGGPEVSVQSDGRLPQAARRRLYHRKRVSQL